MKNIVIVFAAVILTACNKKNDVIQPKVKTLMEAVYASGYVVAKDEYEVYSQAEGYLLEKLVADGEIVKKGDPLFIIDNGQQSSRFKLAKENYDMAMQNFNEGSPVLSELLAALQSAKTKKEFDSLNHVRYTNLIKSNATSQAEYDRMKLTYENSRNEYALQQSRYAKVKNQLYIELENAKSQLQIAGDESGRYIVKSLVNGKVFKTMKDKGELVRRNEVIAVVGNDNTFYLQLNIDELDVQRVKSGQEVLVKIDAYTDKIFHAVIDKVYPMVNQQQQSVRVDATLKESLPGGFSGLAVEANVIIRQKENALVIPKSALLVGDSLLIDTEDGTKKIKVTRGIETLDEVEIMEGLDSVDKLIVNR